MLWPTFLTLLSFLSFRLFVTLTIVIVTVMTTTKGGWHLRVSLRLQELKREAEAALRVQPNGISGGAGGGRSNDGDAEDSRLVS